VLVMHICVPMQVLWGVQQVLQGIHVQECTLQQRQWFNLTHNSAECACLPVCLLAAHLL